MEKVLYTGNLKAIQKLTGQELSYVSKALSDLTKTGTMLIQEPERISQLIQERRAVVAILDGKPVGFGAVTQIYPDGSREIGGITVDTHYQGRRIGTEIFKRVVRREQRRNLLTGENAKLFAFTNKGSYGIAVHQLEGIEETDPITFHPDTLALCKTCPKYASLPQGQICCDRPVIFPQKYIARTKAL